jgi:hypothetical protein
MGASYDPGLELRAQMTRKEKLNYTTEWNKYKQWIKREKILKNRSFCFVQSLSAYRAY